MPTLPSLSRVPLAICFAVVAVVVGAALPASAQAPTPAKHKSLEPAEQVERGPAAAAETAKLPITLPEVSFQDIPIPDVVNFLRDVDPGFQAVVTYEPGVEGGGPRIQDLRLKNVPAGRVLRLIAQAYPQIEVVANMDEGDGAGTVWVIRIKPDPRTPRQAQARTGAHDRSPAPRHHRLDGRQRCR